MDENHEYQKGFNSGYVFAQHKPELFAKLIKDLSPVNDYLDGFANGGKQYELDLNKGHKTESHHIDKEHNKDFGDRDYD